MKIKKKKIIRTIKSLADASSKLESSGITAGNDFLIECQSLAIELGSRIEEDYPDIASDAIIHPLEDYCELTYQLTLPENSNDKAAVRRLAKRMKKTLFAANSAVSSVLPEDKKEIVFLPYKSSMWDSMESVYNAAKADPEVHALVIPIPYFDRNPDGSVKQWHYEGDSFPDDVFVTDYKTYDLSQEKPDVAIIHYGYDGYNIVTSVHPDYYSAKLKENCSCLVYVPYFVLDGVNIGTEFTTVSAAQHADIVIAQTDDERQRYIADLAAAGKGASAEDRVLALGSPKYDRIRNLSSDNVKIPALWKELIDRKKPKRIIFYNSSVGTLLRTDVLQNLQKMIDTFNSCVLNNCLIIWRPHPLMKATVDSMRAMYSEIYQKVVSAFVNDNIGILDEGADMYPAIYLSDIYIGDWSSICWLYRVTGKPVFVNNEGGDELLYLNFSGETDKDMLEEITKITGRKSAEILYSFPEPLKDSGRKIYEAVKQRLLAKTSDNH